MKRNALTDMQTDIMILLSDGMNIGQIANKLDKTRLAIKAHLHRIREFYNVDTTLAAMAEWSKHR
jgi:DNA-binding CsgD family transcriptional regulator